MNSRETILNVVARRENFTFLIDANTSREITYGEFHRQVTVPLLPNSATVASAKATASASCCPIVANWPFSISLAFISVS